MARSTLMRALSCLPGRSTARPGDGELGLGAFRSAGSSPPAGTSAAGGARRARFCLGCACLILSWARRLTSSASAVLEGLFWAIRIVSASSSPVTCCPASHREIGDLTRTWAPTSTCSMACRTPTWAAPSAPRPGGSDGGGQHRLGGLAGPGQPGDQARSSRRGEQDGARSGGDSSYIT